MIPGELLLKDFRELEVWEKGQRLTMETHRDTVEFPREDRYELTSQARRSCASIPVNVTEGCGREGDAEQPRFLRIEVGFASELEYHFPLVRDLELQSESVHERPTKEVTEVKRMLTSFIQKPKAGS